MELLTIIPVVKHCEFSRDYEYAQGRTQDSGRGFLVVAKDTARKVRGEILQNHAH